MLLVAPNWLGVTENVIERAKVLARDRYVAFVADMFGEGKGPKGTENPMEFLAPLINDAAETRRRISAALQAMSKEGNDRGLGDTSRRAAIGYCFGGSNVIDLARAGADVQAVVFSSLADLAAHIDDPELDVEPQDVLVLQNAGPHSADAMPEAGYLPIPKKLARRGVKDMLRISDARMSGTAFGTIVLHITPDAASGGPLGLVRNGDRVHLSVKDRRIELRVGDAELKKRASTATVKAEKADRGYARLYAQEILGADEGCDFAFLKPR